MIVGRFVFFVLDDVGGEGGGRGMRGGKKRGRWMVRRWLVVFEIEGWGRRGG